MQIYREREVTGFAQDETGVDVALSDGRSLRAQYLVGCDGGRSLIRKSAGIEFPGWDPSISYLIAEVEMGDEPEWGIRTTRRHSRHRQARRTGGPRVVRDRAAGRAGRRADPDDLRAALVAAFGTDYGVHSPTWISRFTDMARQAASYREGRVLLAGDAAHVHYPAGGQGLNIGVQDAVNLGWKLAQVVKGRRRRACSTPTTPSAIPSAARVLRTTMAQTALTRADARITALRETMAELLAHGRAAQADRRDDGGPGHPLRPR